MDAYPFCTWHSAQSREITSGIDLQVIMCSQLIKLSVAACVLLVILRASEALDCNQGETTSMRYSQQQSRSKNLLFLHLLFVYVMASEAWDELSVCYGRACPRIGKGDTLIFQSTCAVKVTLFKPFGTKKSVFTN